MVNKPMTMQEIWRQYDELVWREQRRREARDRSGNDALWDALFASDFCVSETEVAEPAAPAAPAEAPPADKPKEEKSALDEAKDDAEPKDANGGSKPPEEGPCRECKRRRRLNRLKLCYPCYVDLNIADGMKKRGQEWKTGDKHPAWCDCEGLGEHPERDNGAWRGN